MVAQRGHHPYSNLQSCCRPGHFNSTTAVHREKQMEYHDINMQLMLLPYIRTSMVNKGMYASLGGNLAPTVSGGRLALLQSFVSADNHSPW